jgi:hypothetical protein
VSKVAFSEAFSGKGNKEQLQKNIFILYWLLGKKIVNLQPVLK